MNSDSWVLVPREPTEAMIEAHFRAHAKAETVFADVPSIWAAMISAAPAPEQAGDVEGLELARRFHEAYERLAPSFGYETRPETREFNPTTPNGRLMVAVCGEVAGDLSRLLEERSRERDEARNELELTERALDRFKGWLDEAEAARTKWAREADDMQARAEAAERLLEEAGRALRELHAEDGNAIRGMALAGEVLEALSKVSLDGGDRGSASASGDDSAVSYAAANPEVAP